MTRIVHRFSLALAATALALSTHASQAQEQTLRIGTEGGYPPFNALTSDGELVGFDIDIARALCAEMEVQCEFVAQDWDGIIPALQAGRYDAIVASMSVTEERLQQVDFTKPYYTNSLVFVAPKDTEFDAADLAGKAIGVQEGTISAIFAEENYPEADVRAYPTQLEAFVDLETGRTDAVFADFGVQYDWINSEAGACCEFKGEPVSEDDKIAIALRKGETELKERFDAAIDAIRADGTYAEINARYFPFDIYGE